MISVNHVLTTDRANIQADGEHEICSNSGRNYVNLMQPDYLFASEDFLAAFFLICLGTTSIAFWLLKTAQANCSFFSAASKTNLFVS